MLTRQAKILNDRQIRTVLTYLCATRHPIRNRLVFLLSVRAGLRAKEIAALRWSMVTDAEGWIGDVIRLPDSASKGRSGGTLPMARQLRDALSDWAQHLGTIQPERHVIRTVRAERTSAQAIVNMFDVWYHALGFDGCSSHSGRRTFITNAARNIGRFGGSLRDVQMLARHSSLGMTQAYIEIDSEAMRKVVEA
jgi:integrase/recombinase XerD